jgi:hypothetical protein
VIAFFAIDLSTVFDRIGAFRTGTVHVAQFHQLIDILATLPDNMSN